MPTVVYTDPAWAINSAGQLDAGRADIERAVYGDAVAIRFGPFRQGRFDVSGPAFLESLAGADAVVIYRAQITPRVVAALTPHCRVVARQGVGTDNLNAELLAQHGILAFNVPDYCVDEVSSHTVAMLLALERQLVSQNSLVKAGRWSIHGGGVPRRTAECTAGIIGFGRIGRATSRKLQPFYQRVLAHDPYVHADLMRGYGVTACGCLAELLAESDAVVVHAPLDEHTRDLLDHAAVHAMRPGALLVNTARGGLVRPEAVLAGLRSGRLGGYAADVFSPEDPNAHPVNRELIALPNTLVSAHRAFLSSTSEHSQRHRVAEEIRRVLVAGEPPLFGRLA